MTADTSPILPTTTIARRPRLGRNLLRLTHGALMGVAIVVAAGAILLAVGTQLGLARELHGTQRLWHVLLAVVTVLTSWLFTQVLFALHYAHDFYSERLRGAGDPLLFPGTADPGYGD